MRPGNRLTVVLTLACLAAAGLITVQWRDEGTTAESPELAIGGAAGLAEAEAQTPAVPLIYDPPSLGGYDAILERPLFVPGRRGEEAGDTGTPEAPPAPAATLNLRLEGVAIAGGDGSGERVAVLRRTTNQEVVRLTPGESVDGWRLVEVHADRVVLRAGERTQELPLEIAGATGRPVVPGPRKGPRPPPRPSR